jgi:hypothetical protein
MAAALYHPPISVLGLMVMAKTSWRDEMRCFVW